MEKDLQELLETFEQDRTVGSKVTALLSRYFSLLRPDLLFTEKRFHNNSMKTTSGKPVKI
jgi:hypothetical protein